MDNKIVEEYDFSKDIEKYEDKGSEADENFEPWSTVLHSKVLTKAQARRRPGLEEAMKKEIRKFETFEAFKRVKDEVQPVIKTRCVYSEGDAN